MVDTVVCDRHGYVLVEGQTCEGCYDEGHVIKGKADVPCVPYNGCVCKGARWIKLDMLGACISCNRRCVVRQMDVDVVACVQCDGSNFYVPAGPSESVNVIEVNCENGGAMDLRSVVCDDLTHVYCSIRGCMCKGRCKFTPGEHTRCHSCNCDRQPALDLLKSVRCVGQCVYGHNTWCGKCGHLWCGPDNCVYVSGSDLCVKCHEKDSVDSSSDSGSSVDTDTSADIGSVSKADINCRAAKTDAASCIEVKSDTHVVERRGIYCCEHVDCTRENECICHSVGRICVFNAYDDMCVRCGCDSKPYRPVETGSCCDTTASDFKNRRTEVVKMQPSSVFRKPTQVFQKPTQLSDRCMSASVGGDVSAVRAVYVSKTDASSVVKERLKSERRSSTRVIYNSNIVSVTPRHSFFQNKTRSVLVNENVESFSRSASISQREGSERTKAENRGAACVRRGGITSHAAQGTVCPNVVSKSTVVEGPVRTLGSGRVQAGVVSDTLHRRPTGQDCVREGGDDGNASSSVLRGESKCDYDHLKVIIDALSTDVTEIERKRVIDLLYEHKDTFSKSEHDLGLTHLIEAEIDVNNARPHCEPLRRHPICYQEPMDKEVDSLLKADVIEETMSSWNFNLVVVKKKETGKIRITTDLRKLNEVCKVQFYPLPRRDDCLDALAGNAWFSTMDVSQSFHQVPLAKESRKYCAFSTRRGSFQYKRMPMGWVNSSAVFSRLMNLILRDVCYVCALCYLDDVVVYGATFDEHLTNLRLVLDRLRDAGLKLKPNKCKILQRQIRFLGYNVSASGISLSEDSIAPIQTWEFPTSVTAMRSLLGLTNYYRMFVKGYGSIVAPLTAMTGKGVKVEKTPAAQRAFEELKTALITAPVLALPLDDEKARFVLDVDASNVGAGAVLSQYQNGELKVIAYASCTFDKAQRAYCVTRRELAAFLFGLRVFKVYLLARDFDVRVDHRALLFLESSKEPIGQAARYLDFMSQFRYCIQYRPGEKHGNADALSRRSPCDLEDGEPCKQCQRIVIGRHSKSRREDDTEDVVMSVISSHGQVTEESKQIPSVKVNLQDPNSHLAGKPCNLSQREVQKPTSSTLSVLGVSKTDALSCSSRKPTQLVSKTDAVCKQVDGSFENQCIVTQVSKTDACILDRPKRQIQKPLRFRETIAVGKGKDVAVDADQKPPVGVLKDLEQHDSVSDQRDVISAEADKSVVTETSKKSVRKSNALVRVPEFPKALNNWSLDFISECQWKDPEVNPVCQWIDADCLPPWEDVKGTSAYTRALYRQYDSLVLRDKVLYRVFVDVEGLPSHYQIVIPRKLITPLLTAVHCDSAAHLKFDRTLALLQAKVWWHTYRSDLAVFIQACDKCCSFADKSKVKQSRLRPSLVGEPCQRFSIDLTGPHVMSNGYVYILTCIDVFSKFLIAVPLRSKTAENVVQALMKHVMLKWGTPVEILSDNGGEFTADVNKELLRALGIQMLRTTPYTPQSNGVCERVHRTLNSMFAKCVSQTQRDWVYYLDYIVFAYNCTPCKSTSLSPYMVHTTRQPRWRLDFILKDDFYGGDTVGEYTQKQIDRMRTVHELVRRELGRTAMHMSDWYNRDAKPVMFTEGEKVRVLDPRKYQGRSHKWSLMYSQIGTIVRCVNESLYLVRMKKGVKPYHVNKLRRFVEQPIFTNQP